MTSVRQALSRSIASIEEAEPLLLLLRASLIVLLVNSHDDPIRMAALAAVSLVALPRPALLGQWWFWAALFVSVGLQQLHTWHTIDDHVIVTTYWCGALALGLRAREPRATLAATARLLVGLVFLFAVIAKIRSGQYIDGTFWRQSLLFDDRLRVIARDFGGATDAIRAADRAAPETLLARAGAGTIWLREGPHTRVIAELFTWWGLAIEGVVAGAFLVPLRRRWEWVRHVSLGMFAATTYLVIPVGGFGALLLLLGAAQATTAKLRTRYYVGGTALLVWAGIWPTLAL